MEGTAGLQPPATTANTPAANPNFLSPPLYLHDPALYTKIQKHLWGPQRGLRNADRVVLGAVFRNMPAPSPLPQPGGPLAADPLPASWLIDRILTLTPPQLRLLARLFTVALLDARSWGGRRPTDNSAPATPACAPQDPTTLFAPLFTALGLSYFPNPVSFDPPAAAPATGSSRRKLRQKENCMLRHDNCCPISLRSATTLTHAHIVPHSISSDPHSSAPFWMFLTLILGPTMRDRFWGILGGGAAYTTMNSIALTQDLRTYFDTGIIHLAPSPSLLSEPFDYQTCTSYDVVFHWYHDDDELNTWTTQLPVLPDHQLMGTVKLSHNKTAVRQLRDRDVFRLYTNRPETLPLVHPLLLDLHGVVWRMIIETGLGESVAGRKRSRVEAGIDGESSRGNPGEGGGTDHALEVDTLHSPPHDVESPSSAPTVAEETEEEIREARKAKRRAEKIRRQLFALESCSEDEDGYESDECDTYNSEKDTRPVTANPLTKEQQRAEKIRRQLFALESCSEGSEGVCSDDGDTSDESNCYESNGYESNGYESKGYGSDLCGSSVDMKGKLRGEEALYAIEPGQDKTHQVPTDPKP